MSDTQGLIQIPKPPIAAQKIVIEYCTLCRWQLRANWLQQEVLSTFPDEIDQVALHPASGGVFRIWLNDGLVWDRVAEGGFPEAKALKQRLRDLLCPDRDLGHIDRAAKSPDSSPDE